MAAKDLDTRDAAAVVPAMIEAIVSNRDYLSEVDGALGDGDHGINMAKGFQKCREALGDEAHTLSEALETLGSTLLNEIGGSMGPLYGGMFIEMADMVEGKERIDAASIRAMLEAGLEVVSDTGGAKVGDKTMLDTLDPAVRAYGKAVDQRNDWSSALAAMAEAAEAGMESTRDLVAKKGRASRMGERSRGPLDAGAVSCCLILTAMARTLQSRLDPR